MSPRARTIDELVKLAINEEAEDIRAQWEITIFDLQFGPEAAAEVVAETEADFADTLLPGELS